MPGTKEGWQKARASLIERYGSEEGMRAHFAEIALKSQESWQRNGRKPRGFAHPLVDHKAAGAIGGRKSRKTKKLPVSDARTVPTDEN